MSYAVYVYADASKVQQKVRSDEIAWTGTWSSTGTYYAASYDSLEYGGERYIAVTDNIGVNPTTRLPNKQPNPFNQLVVFQAGDEPPFAPPPMPPPTQDALYTALTTAWDGTAAAQTALETAWTGTSAGSAALNVLATGFPGTVICFAAFQISGNTNTQLTFVNGILTDVIYPS